MTLAKSNYTKLYKGLAETLTQTEFRSCYRSASCQDIPNKYMHLFWPGNQHADRGFYFVCDEKKNSAPLKIPGKSNQFVVNN